MKELSRDPEGQHLRMGSDTRKGLGERSGMFWDWLEMSGVGVGSGLRREVGQETREVPRTDCVGFSSFSV